MLKSVLEKGYNSFVPFSKCYAYICDFIVKGSVFMVGQKLLEKAIEKALNRNVVNSYLVAKSIGYNKDLNEYLKEFKDSLINNSKLIDSEIKQLKK